MTAPYYVGDLARNADAVVPFASMALRVVSLLAPEHGEAAMQLDDPFGACLIGFNAGLYGVNAASSLAKQADNAILVGSFGDLPTSYRYIAAEHRIFWKKKNRILTFNLE